MGRTPRENEDGLGRIFAHGALVENVLNSFYAGGSAGVKLNFYCK